jgi:hypothetical protein
MFNLKRLGIPVFYEYKLFRFLPHDRTGPEFIAELWRKAQMPRKVNMLETCEYNIVSKENFDTHERIKVML